MSPNQTVPTVPTAHNHAVRALRHLSDDALELQFRALSQVLDERLARAARRAEHNKGVQARVDAMVAEAATGAQIVAMVRDADRAHTEAERAQR